MRKDDYKVALIVPVYNEHETVETFVKTVNEKLASELNHIEIVLIKYFLSDTLPLVLETCRTD